VEVSLVSLHSLFGFLLFNYVGEIGVMRSPIWSMCRRKMRIIGSKACNNCNIVGDGGVAWRGVRQLDPRIGYYIYMRQTSQRSCTVLSCCPLTLTAHGLLRSQQSIPPTVSWKTRSLIVKISLPLIVDWNSDFCFLH
jgi:hypothetical protein